MKDVGVKCSVHNVDFTKDFIIVPLSGGKDSQLCYELAQRQHSNVIAVFCDTKLEHPETYFHVHKLTEGKPFIYLNAGDVVSCCIKNNRFPGGGARHCTDALKIRPSKFMYKFLSRMVGGFHVWYGVRTGESDERAKRYDGKMDSELYKPHDFMSNYPKELGDNGVRFRVPILHHTESEVINSLGGRENPLYVSKGGAV